MSLSPSRRRLIDLYRNICQYADNVDLATLSTVSHAFQHEAERVLYSHVNLYNVIDGERLMLWCLAVISVPRRAQWVHSLKFPVRVKLPQLPSQPGTGPDFHDIVTRAFKAIINLKELFIIGERDQASTPSIYPATLQDCQFRLTAFAGQVPSFTAEDLWKFLYKHPEIGYWVPSQPLLQSIFSFPHDILPNLREMVLVRTELTKYLVGRPIQSLVLVFMQPIHTRDGGLDAIAPLRSFNSTLRNLVYIHGKLGGDWTCADIVMSIAKHVPDLISLTITTFGPGSAVNTDDQQKLVNAVARFQQLETLAVEFDMMALHTPNSENPDPLNPLEHTAFWSGCSPVQCRKIATMFMASCKSLRRISFPFKPESGEMGHLCYVWSSRDNAARLDGFYQIDTSLWWMR